MVICNRNVSNMSLFMEMEIKSGGKAKEKSDEMNFVGLKIQEARAL